ncbi:serine/threonine-protein kinase [Streptomyces sp. NPDC048057]|uniref:serine/threonine-protein kinase n=1 Tax=Streptomyces sp. NPDC048057 TaxID=3155628 RepID=UPI0033C92E08
MGAHVPENQLVAGRYRLLARLGEGGMGVVWRARDEVLGRDVAVKEVRAPVGLTRDDVRRLYARLEREARAAGRISHRNVVTVYDVASDDDRPWIVMELVRGMSLADALEADGPFPPRRAAHIGAEVLAALTAAHAAGVLHRDVKPGNVLLALDGRVVLSDFGIATVEGTQGLTMTGELIGSPEFLAPERAVGRTPGPESDLWSLGVLLYATVEGVTPFRQDTPLNTLRAVVDEELPPPRRAGDLAPVIAGLLHKDPAQRWSAREAERLLRVVAAGGTGRASTATTAPASPSSPSAPTKGAGGPHGPTAPTTVPSSLPGPLNGTPPATADVVRQDAPRRATTVLAVGLAVLLLAVGALVWALLANRGGDDADRDGASGGAGAPVASASAQQSTGTAPGDGATDDGDDDDASDPTVAPQTVSVRVAVVRGSYSGDCPPPESRTPSFRATITVGRTPAAVEYRWVTEGGEGSDERWRTLSYDTAGSAERTVEYALPASAWADGREEAHRDRIRVEVREPVGVRSAWVSFTVTCTGPSPSASGSSTPGAATAPATP